MPTIDHCARLAQYRRALTRPLPAVRTAVLRLALMSAIAAAVYIPGVAGHLPATPAAATTHSQVAMRSSAQCPGLILPC